MFQKKEKELAEDSGKAAGHQKQAAKAQKKDIASWIRFKKRQFLYEYYWPQIYKRASKNPIDPKKCAFICDRYSALPDNMRPVYERFRALGYSCETLLLSSSAPKRGIKKQIYFFRFFAEALRLAAVSKYVFLIDYFMPVYAVTPREGCRIIQLWHACGAFKRFGYSTADTQWGLGRAVLDRFPIHNTYTDVFVSAEKVRAAYADAFNCSIEKIRALGTPRTDIYFDPERVNRGREKLRGLLPGVGDKKVILYAPTYRGKSIDDSYNDDAIDCERMKKSLSDRYVLVYKLHPLVARGFEAKRDGFLYDVSKSCAIEDALCGADIVISDYSSLIFEYSLLLRPMIFYAYDLESYDADRSFYYPYAQFVPGDIVRDTRGIIDAVEKIEKCGADERVRRFRDEYMSACDGSSTARIVDFLTSQL